MKHFLKAVLLCSVAAALAVACSDDDSTGAKVTVSGKLDSTLVASKPFTLNPIAMLERLLIKESTAADSGIKKVWAIPAPAEFGGAISSESMQYIKEINVGSDGTINAELEKTFEYDYQGTTYTLHLNWILVLMDESGNPVGYVSIPTASSGSSSLQGLPVGWASADAIDLGTMTKSGNDAVSNKTTSDLATVVNYTVDQLAEMASTDDTLRILKNLINNCDFSDKNNIKCVTAELTFVFTGDYDQITTDYNRADTFAGYNIYLSNENYDSSEADKICDGTVVYNLYPPSDVVVHYDGGTHTFTATDPLTTGTSSATMTGHGDDAMQCSKNIPSMVDVSKSTTDSSQWQFEFLAGAEESNRGSDDLPSGTWSLNRTESGSSVNVANFDFAIGKPVDDSGHIKVFVPAIKITTDSSGVIQKIYIKWYIYDTTTSSYKEADIDVMSAFIGNTVSIEIADYTGTDTYSKYKGNLSLQQNMEVDIPSDWNFTYNDKSATHYAELIGVFYTMGGQNYSFFWRKD